MLVGLFLKRIVVGFGCIAFFVGCNVYDNDLPKRDRKSANDDTAGGGGDVGYGAEPVRSGQNRKDEMCGDGRVTGAEKCDTVITAGRIGSCPAECPSEGKCLLGEREGSGCSVRCVLVPPDCKSGDGCCPSTCIKTVDPDCSSTCGDGIVQRDAGETCEPESAFFDKPVKDAASICSATCKDDGNPCTTAIRAGSPEHCNVTCTHVAIKSIVNGDGCCPEGANANMDNDCKPVCGNGIREANEECDGVAGCDTHCKSSLTQEQLECVNNYNYANSENTCHMCMCINCLSQLTSCYASNEETRNAGCAKIISCGYSNRCQGRICYCGTATTRPDGICLTGANGPCKQTIEEVAGTVSMLAIAAQEIDQNTAVGRANALTECFERQCLEVCY
jgi:hypothetical protein